jgi:hypothetical protein
MRQTIETLRKEHQQQMGMLDHFGNPYPKGVHDNPNVVTDIGC